MEWGYGWYPGKVLINEKCGLEYHSIQIKGYTREQFKKIYETFIPGQASPEYVSKLKKMAEQIAVKISKKYALATKYISMNNTILIHTEFYKDIEALKPVRVYGHEEPDVILVGWGSTKGPALDALEVLEERGVKARFVQVVYLEPFPSEALAKAMETGRTILLETNVTAQLGRLVKEHTGLTFDRVHTRYDGRPFSPGEIAAVAEGVL